jgi:hydroxylamine dehydrogenase
MPYILSILAMFLLYVSTYAAEISDCVKCHTGLTPGIVKEWELSKHSQNNIGCETCHGDAHKTASDVKKARIPTPETCGMCHKDKVTQFKKGKHAKAWVAMNAMPSAHYQPMALMEGMKGCGGCHKIGLKTEDDIRKIDKTGGYGLASCDACHTRHQFNVKEAQQPQACQTCHMGMDHPHWEMYSSSKHGVRALLKQNGTLPENTAAPTCQTCHLPEGNHTNRTAWGFLAVRLPMPEDKDWATDRTTILKGLGVLDPNGKPTPRLDAAVGADIVRTTQEDWQNERDKMLKICMNCHSGDFAHTELSKGDNLIRESDRLMAEGIEIVAGLYSDMVSKKPEWYAYSYADVLTFHDAPTVIEQKLFLMYMEYRMRTFQGAFHMNPDYSLWYGWSKMKQELTEIKELAEQMRKH